MNRTDSARDSGNGSMSLTCQQRVIVHPPPPSPVRTHTHPSPTNTNADTNTRSTRLFTYLNQPHNPLAIYIHLLPACFISAALFCAFRWFLFLLADSVCAVLFLCFIFSTLLPQMTRSVTTCMGMGTYLMVPAGEVRMRMHKPTRKCTRIRTCKAMTHPAG